jgi:diguanylate cyclase (GGDEF)-like protein/PAS domain S-box-containing protein
MLEDYEYEYRIKRPNGEIRWIRDRGIPVFKADGSLERYDGTNDDITIHKELEFNLKESEERYKNLVEEALVGVYMIQDSELVYVNQWITSFLGKTNQELLGTNFYQLLKNEDKKRIITNFQKLIDGQLTFLIDEIQTTSQDGITKFLEIQAALTSNNGASAIIGIALDITEEKRTKAELEYLAFHDTLTGLPNMKYLNHSIAKDFSRSRNLGIPVSIMFLSLDRFKLINDSFGHHIGDQLLMMISKRLIDSIKQTGEVIRAGGDEFIIYFPDTNERLAIDITEFLLTIFTDRFELNEQEIQLSASIGVAHLQTNDTLEELIQKASSALHFAKALGGNRYRVYSSEFGERANRRLQLEQSLRKAFAEKELEIVYQPKLDLFTNHLTGMEALARWKDPFLGSVSPSEFIPIAEETGMIISIGKWILETACKQNSIWQRNGSSPVHVCVNISSIQFSQDDFVNMVEHVLKASGLAPKYLNLEITEGIALANVEDTIKKLMQLKQLGVSISLDDFGTGYSSLSYLKSLPIDYLKIDRSFINGITKSSQDAAIIDSIITLSHTLSLRVVAEGVEDEQQLKVLKEMGCDEIQGFYYAKPMSATKLAEFLSVNQRQS